ncbi:hypothetical protein ACQ4PT_029213 [Festuca glaucescens]
MTGSDPSEIRFKKAKVKVGTNEAKPNIQGKEHIRALKGDLDALDEKLEGLQQTGSGMVRLECRPMMSFLATFIVGSPESSSSAGVVKYQLKLTCGEDYPAKPPSVDWQDCPVELKPNLQHVLATTNWNAKPQLADVLTDLKNVIVDHETRKKASSGKTISEYASKGKKRSNGNGKD